MNRRFAIGFLSPLAGIWMTAVSFAADFTRPCADCHTKQARAFSGSRMAIAASTRSFLREWKRNGSSVKCLSCHAPSGGAGVVCRDCHRGRAHPVAKVSVPAICARCHDAKGEVTLRSFMQSPAARRGKTCLACHSRREGKVNAHHFAGPAADHAFLRRAATLRMLTARRTGRPVVILQVRNHAGHAIPGGTTGRALWLVVTGYSSDGERLIRQVARFGWEHARSGEWRDRTLKPGKSAILEVPVEQTGVRRVRARLIYRFLPGVLAADDHEGIVVDELEMRLRQ